MTLPKVTQPTCRRMGTRDGPGPTPKSLAALGLAFFYLDCVDRSLKAREGAFTSRSFPSGLFPPFCFVLHNMHLLFGEK
jgi:hypothetical protein